MKAKTFENLIRKIVREEIDYALRREIKSLKEDLRDELKPTITEHKERLVKVPNKPPVSEATKTSLREKIMGTKPIKQTANFVKNETLNSLLNETAQGDTNTQTTTPSVGDPFSNSGALPTEAMPDPLQKVVNRDYRELMQAMDKRKPK